MIVHIYVLSHNRHYFRTIALEHSHDYF